MSLYALPGMSVGCTMSRLLSHGGNIRLPRDVVRVATRIVEIVLEAVKSVSIVPFDYGFCCIVVHPVVYGIHICSEKLTLLTSPNSELHLVVGIVRARIVQDHVSSRKNCAYVAWCWTSGRGFLSHVGPRRTLTFPAVTVD